MMKRFSLFEIPTFPKTKLEEELLQDVIIIRYFIYSNFKNQSPSEITSFLKF